MDEKLDTSGYQRVCDASSGVHYDAYSLDRELLQQHIFPREVKQKNEIKKKVNGRKRGAEEKHTVSVWGIPIVLGW